MKRDLAESVQESAQRLRQVVDLDEKVTNLQKSNKRVWTMYKNERARADELAEGEGVAAAALDWDKLIALS